MHNELVKSIQSVSVEEPKNIGGYLQVLIERYRLIERKLPVFAPEKARQGRYYVTDNFLNAWLGAVASRVSARAFRPVEQLVAEADDTLAGVEGFGLEKLVRRLYEERSRRGIGDFPLTSAIRGYWDRKDTEIDVVAVNDEDRRIRFGSCKRSASKLLRDVSNFKNHVDRFLSVHKKYASWGRELCWHFRPPHRRGASDPDAERHSAAVPGRPDGRIAGQLKVARRYSVESSQNMILIYMECGNLLPLSF